MIDELFRLNCSTFFLLHPIGLNRQKLEGTGFINCYLRDMDKPEYDDLNVVLLLFKPGKREKFHYLLATEKARTQLFIDEYDYDGGYVVWVYEFPEDLSGDYELFLQGKYSQFSEEYRKTVPKYIDVKGVGKQQSFQYMVINKIDSWKVLLEGEDGLMTDLDEGDELWMMPNMKKETLNINELR